MSRLLGLSAACVLMAGVAAFAQEGAQSKPQDFAISGCITKSDVGAGNAGQSPVYMLDERAVPGAKSATPSSGAVATSGVLPDGTSSSASRPPDIYTLFGPPSIDFSKYLGNRVQLTGHLQGGNPASDSVPRATVSGETGGSRRTFEVSDVKTVPGLCQ
jgi:hypothetical protein